MMIKLAALLLLSGLTLASNDFFILPHPVYQDAKKDLTFYLVASKKVPDTSKGLVDVQLMAEDISDQWPIQTEQQETLMKEYFHQTQLKLPSNKKMDKMQKMRQRRRLGPGNNQQFPGSEKRRAFESDSKDEAYLHPEIQSEAVMPAHLSSPSSLQVSLPNEQKETFLPSLQIDDQTEVVRAPPITDYFLPTNPTFVSLENSAPQPSDGSPWDDYLRSPPAPLQPTAVQILEDKLNQAFVVANNNSDSQPLITSEDERDNEAVPQQLPSRQTLYKTNFNSEVSNFRGRFRTKAFTKDLLRQQKAVIHQPPVSRDRVPRRPATPPTARDWQTRRKVRFGNRIGRYVPVDGELRWEAGL